MINRVLFEICAMINKSVWVLRLLNLRTILAGSTLFATPAVFADAGTPDASNMLQNFMGASPQLMQLVTAFAYVAGIYLVVKSILGLKTFGEQRSQMSAHAELKGPAVLMLVGVALLYIPTSVQVGTSTFWADSTPFGYAVDTADEWSVFMSDATILIQLIGTISFIRGLLMMTQLGGQAQPGTLGKASTHLVAGILCINISGFMNMMMATFGIAGVFGS
jgi:hypothetical protein